MSTLNLLIPILQLVPTIKSALAECTGRFKGLADGNISSANNVGFKCTAARKVDRQLTHTNYPHSPSLGTPVFFSANVRQPHPKLFVKTLH